MALRLSSCVALGLFLGMVCLCPSKSSAAPPLPIFPGAQGFGTETKAGRGGRIIKVTNLNNSGSGSLRSALETSGPRIVVFEVSGTISLPDHIEIVNPYLTIAGQTAPSPGITLRGGTLDIRTHDVLVQHIRSRSGDQSGPLPQIRDSWKIGASNSGAYNVVLDHVSGSWGVDEVLGIGRAAHDVTISNSILSEGLNKSIHPEGTHSMGVLIYDEAKNISMIGNLLAHHRHRNPMLKGGTSLIILNNVMYNAGASSFIQLIDSYNSGPNYTSIVGNVFIHGPNTPATATALRIFSNVKIGSKVYHSGNLYPGEFSNKSDFDVSSPKVWHSSLASRPSSTVEDYVLANAGARPADRDSVDKRIIREVRTRTGRIINSQREVGDWPALEENVRPFNSPPVPNGDDDGDGYTNIEEILHQMARMVERAN